MDANQIIVALANLEHGGSMSASCSGGRNMATFSAFTGDARRLVRASAANDDVAVALDEAFASLQLKLANQ